MHTALPVLSVTEAPRSDGPAGAGSAGPPPGPPEAAGGSLGLLGRSPFLARAAHLPLERRLAPDRIVAHPLGGLVREVAQPVTFTPFASVKPCSARCRFCSETLIHDDATALSASLRPGRGYFAALERALDELKGLPLGLSLSGLEATDDADWLAQVITALDRFAAGGGVVTERVLYSNGSGLCASTSRDELLPRLAAFGLTRLELSRHAVDEESNQAIMRFRPGVAVKDGAAFEQVVVDAGRAVPVRLVCVLQQGGVASADQAARYLSWAAGLGVTDVVFRELSRLGDDYRPTPSRRYVDHARVGIESLLDELWPTSRGPIPELRPRSLTAGYYFWNLRARWADAVDVTFETSDYRDMKARHLGDVVHKLVLHANGNLCADWDPNTRVLLRGGR